MFCKGRKMMKKIMLGILLMGIMLGTLTACGNDNSETEELESQTLPKEQLSPSVEDIFNLVSATLIDRTENVQIYENAEQLIKARWKVISYIESLSEFDRNETISIEDANGISVEYARVLTEEIQSLSDLWQYATTVYHQQYVEDTIAPQYAHLYLEQEGRLYKSVVDGVMPGYCLEEMQIWQPNSSLRTFILLPLQTDMETEKNYLLLSIKENSQKPYGLEIMEELGLAIMSP